MQKQKIIYVGGIPGTGKSTLCKAFTDKHPYFTYINSGDIKEEGVKEIYPGRRLSELNREDSEKINDWMMEQILSINTQNKRYILDAHYSHPLPDGEFIRTTPEKHLAAIDAFVLIEALPEIVLSRRQKKNRPDSIRESLIEIEEWIEKFTAIGIATETNKRIYRIRNNGPLTEGIKRLEEIAKTLKLPNQKHSYKKFPDLYQISSAQPF